MFAGQYNNIACIKEQLNVQFAFWILQVISPILQNVPFRAILLMREIWILQYLVGGMQSSWIMDEIIPYQPNNKTDKDWKLSMNNSKVKDSNTSTLRAHQHS